MLRPASELLRKKRPKSGIMERAAFCWRTPFGNRCFWPCPDGRSAERIARDFARTAARIATMLHAVARKATPTRAGTRWLDSRKRLQPETRPDAAAAISSFLFKDSSDSWPILAR